MKIDLDNIKSRIINKFLHNKKTILCIILVCIFGVSLGGFVTYNIMQKQIDVIKEIGEHKRNEAIHKEMITINKALDDLKKNKPITESVINNKTTEIRYMEKSSPEDPDVDIQSPATQSAKVKYNDQIYDIPMETKTDTDTKKDGTVKINQSHEVVVDVTKVADRQIAAYKFMMDEKQRELDEELKDVKKENRNMKLTCTALGVIGAGYLIHKAFK